MQGAPGDLSARMYVWVYEPGVTGVVAGGDPRVRVEIGYGPSGSVADDSWFWAEDRPWDSPVVWEADTSDPVLVPPDNDQYAGAFTIPDGWNAWDYAARVTLDAGLTWVYCDGAGYGWPAEAVGSDDGYQPDHAGQLTVGNPVDYCELRGPATMTVAPGLESDAVSVWVYEAGVTPGAGAGAQVRVQVGLGPRDSMPYLWSWPGTASLGYAGDADGLVPGDRSNDEYSGTFTVPASGAWDYAGRASVDGGVTWTPCDGGATNFPGGQGSADGYQVSHAGKLSVIPR
jgi:hypothetical protein